MGKKVKVNLVRPGPYIPVGDVKFPAIVDGELSISGAYVAVERPELRRVGWRIASEGKPILFMLQKEVSDYQYHEAEIIG